MTLDYLLLIQVRLVYLCPPQFLAEKRLLFSRDIRKGKQNEKAEGMKGQEPYLIAA